MKLTALIVLVSSVLMSPMSIAGIINYDEAIDGDLSASFFELDTAGINSFAGSRAIQVNPTIIDHDVFYIDLASNLQIDSISFSLETTSVENLSSALFSAYVATANDYEDVFRKYYVIEGNGFGLPDVNHTPLYSNKYVFGMAGGYGPDDYSMPSLFDIDWKISFNVSEVDAVKVSEPETLAMLGLGLFFLIRARRG